MAALRVGAWACLCLILLTPFVITTSGTYPYVVGKALYSRLLIEALLVIWVLLWVADARYRPPRSAILLLLAAGLAVSFLAAVFGVGLQRSLWSGYERMQGLIDQTHWVAFTFVLASLLRTPREWRILFNLALAASVGIAFLAIAQSQGLEDSVFGPFTKSVVRLAATFGNPLFLGAYAAFHVLIAAGLLARSFAAGGAGGEWLERCWWGGALALNLWALSLSGARGALLALMAGLGVAALLFLLMPSRSRRTRQVVVAALVFAGVLVAGTSTAVILAGEKAGQVALQIPNPLVRRILTSALWGSDTVWTRTTTWQAGWKGFLERPVLGWGPENFIAPFGRYIEGERSSDMFIHDNAHNRPLEELVTRGPLGLLAFLGAWFLAFLATARAAVRAPPGDGLLYLFAASALAAYFVQQLLVLLSVTGNLVMAVMLAFAVHLETGPREEEEPKEVPPPRGGRAAVAVVAVALAVAGGILVHASWRGAKAAFDAAVIEKRDAGAPQIRATMERAVTVFPPLANNARETLFDYVRRTWPDLRETSPDEADRLIALAEREADRAIASEPANWRLHALVAEMYRSVAAADLAFAEKAVIRTRCAQAMAPNRNVGAHELSADYRPELSPENGICD